MLEYTLNEGNNVEVMWGKFKEIMLRGTRTFVTKVRIIGTFGKDLF